MTRKGMIGGYVVFIFVLIACGLLLILSVLALLGYFAVQHKDIERTVSEMSIAYAFFYQVSHPYQQPFGVELGRRLDRGDETEQFVSSFIDEFDLGNKGCWRLDLFFDGLDRNPTLVSYNSIDCLAGFATQSLPDPMRRSSGQAYSFYLPTRDSLHLAELRVIPQ